jgi:hypothetical protein
MGVMQLVPLPLAPQNIPDVGKIKRREAASTIEVPFE